MDYKKLSKIADAAEATPQFHEFLEQLNDFKFHEDTESKEITVSNKLTEDEIKELERYAAHSFKDISGGLFGVEITLKKEDPVTYEVKIK